MCVDEYIFRFYPTQPSHTFAYLKEADGRWYPYDKSHQVLAHMPVFDDIQAKPCSVGQSPSVVRQGELYGIMDEDGDLVVPVVHQTIEYENDVYIFTAQNTDGSVNYIYYDEWDAGYRDSFPDDYLFCCDTRQKVVWWNQHTGLLLLHDGFNVYTLVRQSRYPWKQPVTRFADILLLSTMSCYDKPLPCVLYQGQTILSIYNRIFTLAVTDFLQPGDLISAFSAQRGYYCLRVRRGEQYMLLWQDGTPLLPDWVDGVVPFSQILQDDCTVAHMALVVQCLQTTVVHLPVTVVG